MHFCHRQTDGRTDRRTLYILHLALIKKYNSATSSLGTNGKTNRRTAPKFVSVARQTVVEHFCPPDCLSVCLSVTRRNCVIND